MTDPTENRLYIVFSWLVAAIFFLALFTWASVLIPIIVTCFFSLYLLLFTFGWLSRGLIFLIRQARSLW